MLMTGLRPRLNVRQRKDPPLPAHSRLFPLQFRPVILYPEHYLLCLPLGPGRQNETDKIYTSRLVPQKLERAPSDSCRPAVTAVFMLAGCEKSDETVSLYQNADDCSAANP